MSLILRPYQVDAINLALLRLNDYRSALIAIFVGAGKSIIMTNVIKKYKRAVILQPCIELVEQNYKKLVESGLSATMIDSTHKGDWDADYIYTTPQTLSKNLDKITEPDLLVIDEANVFYNGSMFEKIFAHWKKCKVLALTATPYYYKRTNKFESGWIYAITEIVSIEEVFGKAVLAIDREEGKALGYGADIDIDKVAITRVYNEHVTNLGIYKPMVDRHLQELSTLLSRLHNGIVYCDSKNHATLISEHTGIPCIFGDTPKKARKQLVADFNSGKIKFLLTVGCLIRGFDKPDLENIIILTNYNNECEVEQIIGRLNRGTCKKTCYYNSNLNTRKPVVGRTTKLRVRKL